MLEVHLSNFGFAIPTDQKTLNEIKVILSNAQAETEVEIEKYQDKVRHIKENLSRLTDAPYFIPHSEIERIKRYLEDRNVFVVLGSEWLLEQRIDEVQKKILLQNIPLLPYAILVEESQIKEISKELAKKSWTNQIPLIFIEKNALTEVYDSENNVLELSSSFQNTWVYKNIEPEFFINRAKIEQLIQQCQDKLVENKTILSEVSGKLKLYEDVQGNINMFFEKYTFDYEQDKMLQINNFILENQKINSKLEDIVLEENTLSEELSDIEKNQEQNEKDIKRLENKKRIVHDFVEESDKTGSYDTKLKDVHSMQKQIRSEEEKLDGMQQKLSEQLLIIEKNINNKRDSLNKLINEQEEFEWLTTSEHVSNLITNEVNYDNAKGAFIAIKEIYDNKNIELIDLEEKQKDFKKMIRSHQVSIEDKDIEMIWLKNNYRVVELYEINEIKEKEKELEIQLDRDKENLVEIKETHDKIEGAIGSIIKSIKDNFSNKKPYFYKNVMEHEYFKRELDKVEFQKNELNQQVAELRDLQGKLTQALYLLEMEYPEIIPGVFEPLQDFKIEPKEIISYTKKINNELKQYREDEFSAKDNVQKKFSKFKTLLEETENHKIRQLARQFDVILAEKRLYDSNFVLTKFAQVLEASDEYKKRVEQLQLEVEKDRKHLIEMAIKRLEAIYDRIVEMPKSSRMNLYGKDIHVNEHIISAPSFQIVLAENLK